MKILLAAVSCFCKIKISLSAIVKRVNQNANSAALDYDVQVSVLN